MNCALSMVPSLSPFSSFLVLEATCHWNCGTSICQDSRNASPCTSAPQVSRFLERGFTCFIIIFLCVCDQVASWHSIKKGFTGIWHSVLHERFLLIQREPVISLRNPFTERLTNRLFSLIWQSVLQLWEAESHIWIIPRKTVWNRIRTSFELEVNTVGWVGEKWEHWEVSS